MTIIRTSPAITPIANALLKDSSLSFSARGAAAFILSHSDAGTIDLDIVFIGSPSESEAEIERAIDELKRAGYITPIAPDSDDWVISDIKSDACARS